VEGERLEIGARSASYLEARAVPGSATRAQQAASEATENHRRRLRESPATNTSKSPTHGPALLVPVAQSILSKRERNSALPSSSAVRAFQLFVFATARLQASLRVRPGC
jgi:hypothetical protein